MQKWTKFKNEEKKNLKASRIIGLGPTCEWVLDVFAQVEFVPMAIAAGRFANARPFHRTGWWIHRRATRWIKSFRKSFDSGADRPRSLCCSRFIMIPNVEKKSPGTLWAPSSPQIKCIWWNTLWARSWQRLRLDVLPLWSPHEYLDR